MRTPRPGPGTRPFPGDDAEVLQCVAPSPVGGLERIVGQLARGQRDRGMTVRVVAIVEPESGAHPFLEELNAAAVPTEVLRVPHRSYLQEVRSLRDLFLAFRPSCVHTHGYRADVLAASVARRLDIPTVSTVHGFTGGGWKNRFYEWLQRRSFARMSAVVAVSRPLARDLRDAGVPEGRLHVVPNAWESEGDVLDRSAARGRLALPEDAYVVGWVGRLSPEKGPDVLVESAARLRDVDVLFSILGTGREEQALRELARELGVSDRVRFHGLVPDAAALFPAFDAFVLSSRSEGTPVSLFEAMEAEVPVIASEVGGVPDVVRGEEALLVTPDDPAALAGALREVRNDPEAARRRAARARRRLRSEFALEPWLECYEKIYQRVAAGR